MSIESVFLEDIIELEVKIRSDIVSELLELGIENCPDDIISRFLLLEVHSKFNNDSRMIQDGFETVLNALEIKIPKLITLNLKQKGDGKLSSFLHDIGKTSNSSDLGCQLAVVKLFSSENIRNPEEQTVSEIIKSFPEDEQKNMLTKLSEVGVTEDMTMRSFYNKHALWTRDILEKYPEVFSERVRIIAASHHIIDRGINPYNLSLDEIPDESKVIGVLEYYVDILEERILTAIDQYQARIARGNITHEKAVEHLRSFFKKYKGDVVMDSIIDVIDELGSKDILFPKTKEKYLSIRSKKS